MKNEVVVVTGASAGLGRAIARHFGSRGAKVGLLARGVDGLEGAKREIEADGGSALVLPTDVADADAVETAAARVEQEFGPIDVWVNNAMTSVFSPVKEMKPEERALNAKKLNEEGQDLSELWKKAQQQLPKNALDAMEKAAQSFGDAKDKMAMKELIDKLKKGDA